MIFVEYAAATGQIQAVIEMPDGMNITPGSGKNRLLPIGPTGDVDPEEVYVDTEARQLVFRPYLPAVVSDDGKTLYGVPDGATVVLTGDAYDMFVMDDSGSVTFDLDPGNYVATITGFPFKTRSIAWTVSQ